MSDTYKEKRNSATLTQGIISFILALVAYIGVIFFILRLYYICIFGIFNYFYNFYFINC